MEQELHDLARQMALPEVQSDETLHARLLTRYAELQELYEHAEGYTYENWG